MEYIKPSQTERPWGNFRQFTNNTVSTVKIINVKASEVLSLQSHSKRTEFWRVIEGDGTVEIEGVNYSSNKGDEYTIFVGQKHRMTGGKDGMSVLEIALGDFEEDDIVRYQDKYGRA
jgi:mannose-6-phosphate isomerase-like protein (cupin superfamily)